MLWAAPASQRGARRRRCDGQGRYVFDVRVRGAFTVSAAATGQAGDVAKLTGAVSVSSIAGNPLTFAWSAAAKPSVKDAGGAAVAVAAAGEGVWRFETKPGQQYSIA